MKKQAHNSFKDGLLTDYHPLSTPPTVLTKSSNLDYVTIEGDQLILQKRMGNDPELWGTENIQLSPGFIPVAVKELNNVAYILSTNRESGEGEIGTFPAPDYVELGYEQGDYYHEIELTITDVYDDGTGAYPNFTLIPTDTHTGEDVIKLDGTGGILHVYVELGKSGANPAYWNLRYEITNDAKFTENYSLQVQGNLLVPIANSIDVIPTFTETFDVAIDGDEVAFEIDSYVRALPSADPTLFKDSLIKNITVYPPWTDSDPDSGVARKDTGSISGATGNNIHYVGGNIDPCWASLLDDPPVVYAWFAFDPVHPHKNIQYSLDLKGIHTGDATDGFITAYKVLSSTDPGVSHVGDHVHFIDSAYAEIRLLGLERFTGDAANDTGVSWTFNYHIVKDDDDDAYPIVGPMVWTGDQTFPSLDPGGLEPTITMKTFKEWNETHGVFQDVWRWIWGAKLGAGGTACS